MNQKVIACEVMKEELLTIPAGPNIEFEFLPQKRHNNPEKLGLELQSILDNSNGYSRVVLGYGLCGGATKKLQAGDFILTIPRVHECTPLLFGSQESYEKQRLAELGTLYMSAGWTGSEGSIIGEYRRTCEKYGEKMAAKIHDIMYNNYKRVLFIRTGIWDDEKYIQRSREIGRLLKLRHEITQGNLRYFNKLVNGPWLEDEFINVPPHGLTDEAYFFNGIK